MIKIIIYNNIQCLYISIFSFHFIDGLIILNKPYGIKRSKLNSFKNSKNNVPNGINYTLEDALPYIAKELNYPNLSIIRSPEM